MVDRFQLSLFSSPMAETTPFFITTWLILIGSLNNFIYGYEIGVGWIILSPHFQRQFYSSTFSTSCELKRAHALMVFVAVLFMAAAPASLLANYVTRKKLKLCLSLSGLLLFSGAVVSVCATKPKPLAIALLFAGRALSGFGVGLSQQVAPLYLADMAPPKPREGLKIGPQFSFLLGAAVAGFLNFYTAEIGWGWRLSLGIAMIPSLIMTICVSCLPNTPKSLIELGKREEAGKILRILRGRDNVEEELSDLEASSAAPNMVLHPWSKDLWKRKYIPHNIVAVFMAIFQQLTGNGVIMFDAPMVFKSIRVNHNVAIVWPVIDLLAVVGATVLCWCAAYHLGRKLLILQGCLQIVICLLVLYMLTKLGSPEKSGNPHLWYPIVSIVLDSFYAAGYARSWGTLGWLVPSEMYPVEIRTTVQTMNFSVNMVVTSLISLLCPLMLCYFKPGLYLFFATSALVMILFVWFLLPDTKGVPLARLSLVWTSHWFWRRFAANDTSDAASSNTKNTERTDHTAPETKDDASDFSEASSSAMKKTDSSGTSTEADASMTDSDTSETTDDASVFSEANSSAMTKTDSSGTSTETDSSDAIIDIPPTEMKDDAKLAIVDTNSPGTNNVAKDVTDAKSSDMTDIEKGEHTPDRGM